MDTDSLRKAAPNWNLAGDKQLLGVLQQIHQSLMTKCQDTNSKLDAIVDALDNASIDLQNVNNKFMALSNTQFIECRVYDDDVDIKTEDSTDKPDVGPTKSESDLDRIKRTLQKLEMMHEPVHILDSSDDEEESSMILKPKDMYSNRPLPYIIGSESWKKNWHVGLITTDSDSESSSKEVPGEEYSESEHEDELRADTIYSSDVSMSSEVSEVVQQPRAQTNTHTAAQIAAQIANRLSSQVPPPPPLIEDLPPEPTTSKVYRMDKPLPATIFSNEPPPLESSDGSDDDIFAELHKKPHSNSYRNSDLNSDVVDELFGDNFKSDIGNIVHEPSNSREKSPLFNDPARTEPTNKLTPDRETNVKKPVGGISVFGSNKGAESIGAAILKRHQRHSSDSDVTEEQPPPVKENKNILDELFTKPNKKKEVVKKTNQVPVKKDSDIAKEKPKDKIDLFSDNLFDDIDDIFTTNIATKPKTEQKSIFDDDDLFSDVVKDKPKDKKDTKNIFDSDDLFTENDVKATDNAKSCHQEKGAKSFFDSDDDLFTENDAKVVDIIGNKNVKDEVLKSNSRTSPLKDIKSIFHSNENLSGNDIQVTLKADKYPVQAKDKTKKVRSIFDDDSDDDLFSNAKTNESSIIKYDINKDKPAIINNESDVINNKIDESKVTSSNPVEAKDKTKKVRSIFDDNSDDDLFSDAKINTNESSIIKYDMNKDKPAIIHNESDVINNKTDEPKVTRSNTEFKEDVIKDDNSIFTEKNDRNIPKNKLLTNADKPKQLQSPNLFDDDEIDDLFTNKQKIPKVETHDSKENQRENIVINEEVNKITNVFDDSNSESLEKSSEHVISGDSKDGEQITVINTNYIKTSKISNENSKIKSFYNDNEQTLHNEDMLNDGMPESRLQMLDDQQKEHLFYDPIASVSKEVNKELFDDLQKEPLLGDHVASKPQDSDIFSDIFNDLPPDFEKPVEPKRSKNVNALFDDDSDDEALFFKKNDVISDEKPDLNSNNDRFSIFHDEPPDIDVDFSQKPLKSVPEKNADDIFDDLPKIDSVQPKIADVTQNSQHIFENKSKILNIDKKDKTNTIDIRKLLEEENEQVIDIPKLLEQNSYSDDSNTLSEDNVTSILKDNVNEQKTEIIEEIVDNKKQIGKLKPMNFNINVNTLLPGGSPKKSKSEKDDNTENVNKSGVNKTIIFDDPDSGILDNKLSKERAKIQVKRRPSTRRARLEAVRKSYIDRFEESITREPKSEDQVEAHVVQETHRDNTSVKENVQAVDSYNQDSQKFTDEDLVDRHKYYSESKKEINVNTTIEDDGKSLDKNIQERQHLDRRSDNKTEAVKKVVYILNDEDIFTDSSSSLIDTKKDSTDKKDFITDPIKKDKKRLFDDLSDEELFGNTKKLEEVKDSLFDSDSEGELFSKSKKISKKKDDKVVIKGSLFGDESDDDLFASKPAKITDIKQQINPSTSMNTSTEPVFEDPLSMLSDEC